MSDRFYGVVEWCAGALPSERVTDVARLLELTVAYQAACTQCTEAFAVYGKLLKDGGWLTPPTGEPAMIATLEAIDVADARRAAAAEALLQHAGDP